MNSDILRRFLEKHTKGKNSDLRCHKFFARHVEKVTVTGIIRNVKNYQMRRQGAKNFLISGVIKLIFSHLGGVTVLTPTP